MTIDKGVPVPLPARQDRWPFRGMKPGDSFFVPGAGARQFRGNFPRWEKVTGYRFCVRTEAGGVRVWMTRRRFKPTVVVKPAVERGIPAPPRWSWARHIKYPWSEMNVGDSFWLNGFNGVRICNVRRLAQHRLKRKFRARNEGTGVRVWRVE